MGDFLEPLVEIAADAIEVVLADSSSPIKWRLIGIVVIGIIVALIIYLR